MKPSPIKITDLLDDCLFLIFKYIPYVAETIRLKRGNNVSLFVCSKQKTSILFFIFISFVCFFLCLSLL